MVTGVNAIPRIFHRIWLGGPMPEEFVRFGKTFEHLHPDWEMRLWNERNLPQLRNQVAFDAAPSFAQKADILRYELLFAQGGVYLDTDFECLKPLDELLSAVRAFAASEDTQWISIGILGAVPAHPLFGAVIEELPRSVASQPDAAVNVQTGPLFFTRVVTSRRLKRLDEDFVVFPPKLFYPYGAGEKHRRHEAFPEAHAVHHWAGSWSDSDSTRAADAGATAARAESASTVVDPQEPLRLLVGFDPEDPNAALALLIAYRELFTPEERVELGVYAYAEPSLPLLDCVQQLLRLLVGDPSRMAPLSLYSRAELSMTPYDAAFFPTGNAKEDATQMARAFGALHAFRVKLDGEAGRVPSSSLPQVPPRAEVLERAEARPGRTSRAILPRSDARAPAAEHGRFTPPAVERG
jgi:hypothetical protein